ncbi:hypothetical protein JI735_24325 [Paenibacillus sonchi]|uniref:DUF6985 domain-containing protein n=1 Tax=Paenibacillus sonchi TaxID=373687 RepID=A0A974SC05_9BACL|nr:hypothetical protein [Paenibacillus sonchi]QQZ59711.1 hypothetical protein JI735_24325 [Paenibacillus sonchi]
MSQIEHQVFGLLNYDYGWKKNIVITMFGHEKLLTLSIDADIDAEFEDAQIIAYKFFFRNMNELLMNAEDEILKYYLEVIEEYRERLGEKFADKMAPVISSKEELSKLIEPKRLLFPMVFDERVRQVGLLLECTWEPEHGLAVKFEDEKIVEVGYQDIVL